ncbi:MAG: amidase, partial [Rhizobiales bacterium]|nr:amidase [Hyphomicrobiales bacterium]
MRLAELVQRDVSPFVEICKTPTRQSDGILQGLPYVAKDMFQYPGRKPSWGLAHPVDNLPVDVKADVLSALDNAGASLVGFTRMTALAYEPSGVNPLQHAPLNPWNPSYAPGASSSGSAVAVASGAAFAALGSDTGGSLRIPAQGCGVTAWKPTNGTVSTNGAMPLAPSLDAIGILARSGRDIQELLAVLLDHERQHEREIGQLNIGVVEEAIQASDSSVRMCCETAMDTLSRCGLRFNEYGGMRVIQEAAKEALVVMQAEAARAHCARLGEPEFDPMLARRLSKGLEISDEDLSASLERRTDHQDTLFNGTDLLLLPVMPIGTPPLAETDPSSAQFSARTLYALSNYTRFANYLGLPAVAFPVGFDDRQMPVAMQLVGRPG